MAEEAIKGDEKMHSHSEKRKQIRMEILSTEETYTKGLQLLQTFYLAGLVDLRSSLKEDELKTLQMNIKTLYLVHHQFLTDAQKSGDDDSIVNIEVLATFAQAMKSPYKEYLVKYEHAMTTMAALRKKHKKVDAKLNEIDERLRGAGEGKGLLDFFITPVQRLPRYVMLTQELLKSSSENHPQYALMEKTLETLKTVTTEVNDHKRSAEAMNKLLDISAHMKGSPKEFELVQPHRSLIFDQEIIVTAESSSKKDSLKSASRKLYLFTDMMLVTKPDGTYKQHVSTSAVSCAIPAGAPDTDFEIMTSKVHLGFRCASQADRDNWMALITERTEALKKRRDVKRRIKSNRTSTMKGSMKSADILNSLQELKMRASVKDDPNLPLPAEDDDDAGEAAPE